jgi:hypothetical protein
MICNFFAWIEEIKRIHTGFFNPPKWDTKNVDSSQRMRVRLAGEHYGWFVHIMILAGGDVLKLEEVAKLDVHTALHTLGFKNYIS